MAKKKTHCKNGHARTPDNVTKSGNCRACNRDTDNCRYSENPKKYSEKSRKWRLENLERSREINNRGARKWQLNNPDKFRKNMRKSKLKVKYGLTPVDIPDTCQVCGGNNGARPIFVDHNHATGKVRGFLCSACNCILGYAKDDPQLLEKLALYLREKV